MPPKTTPPSADSGGDTENPLGPLAHRMNHALAYLVNHLNVLSESIEQSRTPPEERARILAISTEALQSAERLGDLIRQVKVLSWGTPATRESRQERAASQPPADDDLPATDDDTWDSEHSARILVIDDEDPILQACQRALQAYAVDVASTAERALELIKVHPFDLILCDLNMPGISGMEIFDWMKANQAQRLDRLVFMTGGVFSSQLRSFLSSIRNPVLHKPFDTKTLRWMVAQKLREFETRAARGATS